MLRTAFALGLVGCMGLCILFIALRHYNPESMAAHEHAPFCNSYSLVALNLLWGGGGGGNCVILLVDPTLKWRSVKMTRGEPAVP